ncbi:MAG: lysoplasmalogenase [Deltaproteobacteria bacterium]|nr:lysoplasmalogenase [Deltaproteobacteria bacterium]
MPRPRPFDLAYWLLASVSIAVIPLGPFTGLAALRMAPTLLLAGVAWAHTRRRFGVTIGLGLFLGAWGDWFLSTFDPDLAPLGVVAFLLGHISYIAGLRGAGWQATAARRAAAAGLVTFGLAYGGYIAWVNPLQPLSHILWFDLQPAPQLLPVAPALLAYMPWLIGMACVAVLRRGSRVLAAGALVFVASDAMIPLNQFLLPKPAGAVCASNWLMFAGFLTYYAAQFWIAKGAMDEAGPAGQGH